jgi:hypothetical protein
MNTITNRELEKGGLKTADLAAFAEMPPAPQSRGESITASREFGREAATEE